MLQGLQRVAAVVVGLRIVGIEMDGLLIARERGLEELQGLQRVAAVVVSLRLDGF